VTPTLRSTGEIFDDEYYRIHCDDPAHPRSTPEWPNFFEPIADAIVLGLAPRKVFDAGCAAGFLAEKLWDRGVETHGRDISELAISQMRADVRPWCEVGSIAEPIEGTYDLVLCVEVLEHMPTEEALASIRNLTAIAPRILFSASPTDREGVTCVNVRPIRYWLERFAEAGFAPTLGFDATSLSPHAFLFERSEEGRDDRSLAAFAEIVRQRLEVAKVRQTEKQTRKVAVAGEIEARLRLEAASVDAIRRESAAALEAARRETAAAITRANVAEARVRLLDQPRTPRVVRNIERIAVGLPFARRALRRREQRRIVREIRQSDLFDTGYYFANNPDVAASGIDPALHFATNGWKEGRKPSPGFDPQFYLSKYPDVAASGMNPLLHYARTGREEGRQTLPGLHSGALTAPPYAKMPGLAAVSSVASLLRTHNAALAPLPVFADHRSAPTLTILTDRVDPDHLFGGVATAMVVGAFVAQRLGGRLRLATRDVSPDPAGLGNILRAHRIKWEGPTDFLYLPPGDQRSLSLGDQDIILTTSWWTTRATLGSVNPARIIYLLQQDERMFYSFGDQRLQCMETLSEPELRILVNTQQLFDHLADGFEPLSRLRERGHWFDPAFPSFPRPKAAKPPAEGAQNFFFYARPNNDRNLFWRGLEVINAAMREGVLAPDQWNFHFVGRELPDMELPGGVQPTVWSKLPWSKYAELVSRMDLGLCLMDTPHPSYPPLDLAAAGAVVVTNTHGSKKSFERWSRNIIAAPPSVSALTDALREGIKLSRDPEQRFANCGSDHIPRDWGPQLDTVIERMLDGRSGRACS